MPLHRRDFILRAPGLAAAGILAARHAAAETVANPGARPVAVPPSAPPAPLLFQGAQLHNIDRLELITGGGTRLCRVPQTVWEKMNAMGKVRAFTGAGAELRFNLVGPEAKISVRFAENRGGKAAGWPVLAEVYQGDFLMRCAEYGSAWTEIVIRQPSNLAALSREGADRGANGFDPALVRLALPYMPETQLLRIDGQIEPPRSGQVPVRSYLAYGSSITHGSYALRSGDTYPTQVGRALGANVINLGFGAAAYLEPEMADWIAGRHDWDFATLELGVNLLPAITTAEFARRVDYFLRTLVRAHPDRPLFVIDIFTSGRDLEANPKRAEFRAVVRDAVARLASDRVHHLDGRQLFTRTTGLCFDLLHPSSEGFREIAGRLTEAMRPALGLTSDSRPPA